MTPKMFSDAFEATRVGGMWGFADWFPSYNLSDPAAGIIEINADDPAFVSGFGLLLLAVSSWITATF